MARIRSIHPGLFTDEEFAPLSSDAQILYVGLLTEADDQGMFEWKPMTLRMRLRAAKDGQIEPLLAELVKGNCIRLFDVGGRKYGAVRNFRKYQRPKKPNAVHPMTDEIRTYVALCASSSELSEDEGGGSSGKSPQMEEGGGMMEEEQAPHIPPRGGDVYSEDFERWWAAYPNQTNKSAAWKQWEKSFIRVDLQTLIDAAKRYGATNPGGRAWCNPSKWLRESRWQDGSPAPAVAVENSATPEENLWIARIAGFDRSGFWNRDQYGPTPDEPGCKAPKGLLENRFDPERDMPHELRKAPHLKALA